MKKIIVFLIFPIYLLACPPFLNFTSIILNKPDINIKLPAKSEIEKLEKKYSIKIDISKINNFTEIVFKSNPKKSFDSITTQLNLYNFFENKDAIKSWERWLEYLNKTKDSKDIELYKLISDKIINRLRDRFPHWIITWDKPYLITFFAKYPDVKNLKSAKEDINKMNLFLKKVLYGAYIPLSYEEGKNSFIVNYRIIIDSKDNKKLKKMAKELLKNMQLNKDDINDIVSKLQFKYIVLYIPSNCPLNFYFKDYGWNKVPNNSKITFKDGCPDILILK